MHLFLLPLPSGELCNLMAGGTNDFLSMSVEKHSKQSIDLYSNNCETSTNYLEHFSSVTLKIIRIPMESINFRVF